MGSIGRYMFRATLGAFLITLVSLTVVHGAGHVESWNVERTRYEATLRTFLEPILRP